MQSVIVKYVVFMYMYVCMYACMYMHVLRRYRLVSKCDLRRMRI